MFITDAYGRNQRIELAHSDGSRHIPLERRPTPGPRQTRETHMKQVLPLSFAVTILVLTAAVALRPETSLVLMS